MLIRDSRRWHENTRCHGHVGHVLVTEVHNLRELAERPFLLRLITGQIGQLEAFRRRGESINAAPVRPVC